MGQFFAHGGDDGLSDCKSDCAALSSARTMTKLQPIKNRVLIALAARATESLGGIIIPEAAQKAEQWGDVIAVGEECTHLRQGDCAFIAAHQGTHYIEDGRDYILIHEDRIIARKLRPEEQLDATPE